MDSSRNTSVVLAETELKVQPKAMDDVSDISIAFSVPSLWMRDLRVGAEIPNVLDQSARHASRPWYAIMTFLRVFRICSLWVAQRTFPGS